MRKNFKTWTKADQRNWDRLRSSLAELSSRPSGLGPNDFEMDTRAGLLRVGVHRETMAIFAMFTVPTAALNYLFGTPGLHRLNTASGKFNLHFGKSYPVDCAVMEFVGDLRPVLDADAMARYALWIDTAEHEPAGGVVPPEPGGHAPKTGFARGKPFAVRNEVAAELDALEALGDPEKVAAHLTRLGTFGIPGDRLESPLCAYMEKWQKAVGPISVGAVLVTSAGESGTLVGENPYRLGPVLAGFGNRFDAYEYPELIKQS